MPALLLLGCGEDENIFPASDDDSGVDAAHDSSGGSSGHGGSGFAGHAGSSGRGGSGGNGGFVDGGAGASGSPADADVDSESDSGVDSDVANDAGDSSPTDGGSDVVVSDGGSDASDASSEPLPDPNGLRFSWYTLANDLVRVDGVVDTLPLGVANPLAFPQDICTDLVPSDPHDWDCYITATPLGSGSRVYMNVLIDDGSASGTYMCSTSGCRGFVPIEYAAWNGGTLLPNSVFADTIDPGCNPATSTCLHFLTITIP